MINSIIFSRPYFTAIQCITFNTNNSNNNSRKENYNQSNFLFYNNNNNNNNNNKRAGVALCGASAPPDPVNEQLTINSRGGYARGAQRNKSPWGIIRPPTYHRTLSLFVGVDAHIDPPYTEAFSYVARADVGIGPYIFAVEKKVQTFPL